MEKKRGRKPLPEGEARTCAIGIALTPREYDALTSRALTEGKTLAQLLREAIPFEARGLVRGDVGAGTTRRSA